ncbi:MAG: aminotransferase class V-fold PLP-dependent enzyme [Acidimicrobiia bacterium]|nr:aminotransferase class V-fold PLP-dependent enzyme [Acidimicrobiia bacterium]
MIDIDAVRADTPACGLVLHLNNAGASLPPRPVVDAQIDYLMHESMTGGYELTDQRQGQIAAVYESIAGLLGCTGGEIALMGNATEAWNAAFAAIEFQPGDRILTAEAEYASNLINFIKAGRTQGAVVEVVPSTEQGELSIPALESMMDDRVKLIAVSHIPTNGGLVNPAEAIGEVARSAGVTYLLDACQSVGQLDLDVDELGCDLLTATGRKYLRGPRGTGFLYVRNGWTNEPQMLDLHSARWTGPNSYDVLPDARRFETWEFGYASLVGLGAAVDYALDLGLAAIEQRVVDLADQLRRRLAAMPGVNLTDLGLRKCGIVTFTVDGFAAGEIVAAMHEVQINLSVSGPSSTPVDAGRRHLSDLVRASVHYFNTTDELDRFMVSLESLGRS